ncbi:DeoR/GlpR family DNA-binding transcription regulator [Planomonospora sp. ID82291]|uniref:DeoR/GlpR family DNA-binding transcription regulator n=1 Tax=Planomonospora sp. ID82291 TaxID=2738136 RepID=UPI0018C42184|nr:DeoR/GlpR family DNA-binding transcription regulator [Planomonospora sp. ID82291]MBG0815778.1 DeoR/GlpR transcriptional regulator [Planomonospora sp. ID82291]
MLAQQRQQAILERVRGNGGVRVADLVRELGVSDMTIRRDLEVLAERGLLEKVHGGATAAGPGSTEEPGFAAKSARQQAEKEAIARQAARFVRPGTAIALSAGTTTWTLAHFVTDVPELTVITNSIRIADVFHRSPRADRTVVLTGGVRTPSDALVGPVAAAAIRRLHVDTLFLGVHGMSARAGFTTPNLLEAETDRELVASAHRLVVPADHTKWETVGISTIARLSEAHVVISDPGLPEEAREELSTQAGELIIAEPEQDRQVADR